ncbi:hypothetical protein HII12_001857 [Brettanomyces bruxellensis]|uniref:DEBR0S1_03554g1_1 n=1 Tax=Dekkera bruxellensis TaxID=5007 RepID=A0A7D9GX10_DEKBR|nr:hypothetical protein HII12_001857 [Brettanomyces bruxellensis]VUG15940.1 DEBR0S1_03554g1_1 [Brettanomyces bruxellensis]
MVKKSKDGKEEVAPGYSALFDVKDLYPAIDAIIKVMGTETLSVKRVRKTLEAMFNNKFKEHREEIRKSIVDRYLQIRADEAKNENAGLSDQEKMKQKIEQLERENRMLSAKLNAGLRAVQIHKGITKRKTFQTLPDKKPKKRKMIKASNLSKKEPITPELARFLGTTEQVSRVDAIRIMWKYIKENNLQNPKNRKEILCDDRMKPIFGDKIGMFETSKVISKHFIRGNSLPPSKVKGSAGNNTLNDVEVTRGKNSSSASGDSNVQRSSKSNNVKKSGAKKDRSHLKKEVMEKISSS